MAVRFGMPPWSCRATEHSWRLAVVFGEWRSGNASEELQGDREVVMEAVKRNGLAHRYASEELRRDREVAKARGNAR
eukprot:6837448-Heterocapsa_arctica.AAC.1